ncbi:MAG: cyclic pyranopterin monophosphate synthase MoaC [Candidatus Ozemobacteraceae bacterium]
MEQDHPSSSSLTHLDSSGRVSMVDVGGKAITVRSATAFGIARVGRDALSRLIEGGVAKGDAFAAARIAGIMGAKKTSELIPLTHPLGLDLVQIFIAPWREDRIVVFGEARTSGRTGVEMEAMTAVSVALLTLYDMLKAVTKGIVIETVRLLRKTGGKSGDWSGNGVGIVRVEKLATSPGKGTPKLPVDEAMLRVKHGLEGDAHAADWHRQVSLLGVESIAKMQAKGLKVDFGSFAENIATSGVELYKLPIGSLMAGGDGVVLEVTQIGKECHSHCAVYHQAGDCVMPREGIFAQVLAGGRLITGDRLIIIEQKEDVPSQVVHV